MKKGRCEKGGGCGEGGEGGMRFVGGGGAEFVVCVCVCGGVYGEGED